MRTYYFAAETRELMTQWINALSLATILQEGTKLQCQNQPSINSMASFVKQNSEDCNSGFQSYNSCSGPITIQPTSQERNLKDGSGNVNGWVPHNPSNPYQPLYANAPPKPKRLNSEGQYAGSSPEASPSRRDDSENVLYGSRRRFEEIVTPIRQQEYHYHPYKAEYQSASMQDPDMVRSISHSATYSGENLGDKTPDQLRWDNIKPPNYTSNTPRKEDHSGNYSDVYKNSNYNLGMHMKADRPNFSSYGNSSANYQHSNQYYQSYQQASQKLSDSQQQDLSDVKINPNRRHRQPPRPHSADFLDHDSKKYYPNKKNIETITTDKTNVKTNQYNSVRPPRPKSSLDIVHSNDGYYWSEEHYAEKMRQSAMYLQNTLPQRSQSSRANTPILRRLNESSTLSEDSKSFNSEPIPVIMRQKRVGDFSRDATKSPSRQNLRRWSEHQDRTEGNFIKSGSARLPKQRAPDDESDEIQTYTGGEDFNEGRKEESMKRLLEWKQRMLQSPLTRKLSGSSARGVAQNELSKYYKQQVLKELEKQEAKSREEMGKRRSKADGIRMQNRIADGRRSAILSSDRYYSYSSDDEGKYLYFTFPFLLLY